MRTVAGARSTSLCVFQGQCQPGSRHGQGFGIEIKFSVPLEKDGAFGGKFVVAVVEKKQQRNPGQGHLPVKLVAGRGGQGLSVTLAGRDLLSLEIARHNCVNAGKKEGGLRSMHVASLFDVEGGFDRIIIIPDADSGIAWHHFFLPSLLPLLNPEGIALAAARSSFLGRVDLAEGVRVLEDMRTRGYRGIMVRHAAGR